MNEPAPPPDERPWRRREYSGAASTLGLAALIVVTVGVAIWYFQIAGGGSGGNDGDAHLGIVALADEDNPTGEAPVAQEGRAAPNFRLRDIDGVERELTDFRGKVVVLNFWASWCGPCRDETPALQEFHEQVAADDWVVLGVNQQEQRDTAVSFLDEFGVTYPVVLDSSGEVSEGYRVGARGVPISFIIGPTGEILAIHLSSFDRDDLQMYRGQVREP